MGKEHSRKLGSSEMDFVIWSLSFIGHLGLWCTIFNQVHATAWPRPTRKVTEKATIAGVLIPIIWVASLIFFNSSFQLEMLTPYRLTSLYVYGCVALGCGFILLWLWRKFATSFPDQVLKTQTEWVDWQPGESVLHGPIAKTLGLLPFNQTLSLTRQRMEFALDVPSSLDGLKICQLSDFHFTGQIGIEYFQNIIQEANSFEPDLVFITGDIVDTADCLDWLPETIGKLESKHGVFYVLGNHDRRVKDESMLRKNIEDLGVVKAAGNWISLNINGGSIALTGNALPWYDDANQLVDDLPPADLRILISHSPDQLNWACKRQVDLMFAGHTHGGQIQLPIIGPIIAPSKYGVRYASGTFAFGDLLMHVSRGLSGDDPIRIGSPPEIGFFTIRAKRS